MQQDRGIVCLIYCTKQITFHYPRTPQTLWGWTHGSERENNDQETLSFPINHSHVTNTGMQGLSAKSY